ncbi:hypothetical protein PHJA_001154000 [Phtheirospermum japonicum]|uniref:DUF7903 domain-containing protein n=1 Tax=Phtheirospermum japonicum TaxID=374723 RepID=A0A830BVT4_9LAMI|nr:hypothetical protein PHJA_001154000 [Phtheirospermum japonicum]
MAYIPPHMRQSKGAAVAPSPAPPPESLSTRFQRNLKLKSKNYPKKILYSEKAISKWFVVGLADESRTSDLARLDPVATESSEKPVTLVLKENGVEASEISQNPWDFVAERVKQDLFSSLQNVKNEMMSSEFNKIKPTLILRFGKDEELENIKRLINSARLDSEVKGGLRWPLGKQVSGDRYTVVGAWHTISETYTNSSMRLKVRHADRFDFRASSGEVAKEVHLTMPGVASLLRVSVPCA